MAKGWISIHRKIQDCDIWTDAEPFDRRSAWVDLLLSANHEDRSMLFDGHRITIRRGQLLTSVRKLSDRWRWSKDRTLRYLRLLEDLEMIERESNARRTLLTIIKYEDYQNMCDSSKDTDKDRRKDTHKDTRKDTDTPQTIMINNENNENKGNNMGRFTPPTLEEVEEYCFERNNNVDAQSFIDFYSAKGWMIGKNKMKDWKAAVRTWESKRKAEKPKQMMTNNYDFGDLEKRLLGG